MRLNLFVMKNLALMSFAFVLFVASSCNTGNTNQSTQEKSTENWIQLFNGKDLDGWTPKFTGHELGENYRNTFRVENGILRVCYDDWNEWDGAFGHLFYKDEFSHYRLRAEYRFVGEQTKGGPSWAFRNNGLMLHGQSAASMELDQQFPTSVEVQLLGGIKSMEGYDPRSNLNVCTPGTNIVMNDTLVERHCTSSTSPTFYGDDWVTVEVEVVGNEVIRHFVNGQEVLSYNKPQLDPKDEYAAKLIPADGNLMLSKGTISLQAESSPTEFRKVELLVLYE